MHLCRCHIRTLESLASDFASLNLRQQRAQRFFRQARQISTRPPARQLEATHATFPDDSFVPFDITQIKQKVLTTPIAAKSSSDTLEDGELTSEDWHAELEILSPRTTKTAQQGIVPEQVELSIAGGRSKDHQLGPFETVDNVSLRQLHPALQTETPYATPPVLLQDPVAVPVRTKAESRQKRKLRRMEAGRYNRSLERPTTVHQMKEERAQPEPTQMETVLAKLNELEGSGAQLPMTTRKPKVARSRDASDVKFNREAKKADKPRPERLLPKPKREKWAVQKEALEDKFGEAGWQPRKRLSPDTLEGIRALHASDPASYTTELLSEHFKITPEAIRRILRSKWRPNDHEAEDRKSRWERRGVKKWQDMAEQGVRPPAKWRAMGVGSADGPAEDKVPKRRRKREDDHVGWDGVVDGGIVEKEVLHESLAERIL